MKLLAIDTSSNACSVAVQVGEDLSEQHVVEPREHTRILVPMIEELLQDAGVELPDLDAVVLGNGPGSFIGMRIGASVAQGICHGAGLKMVPLSSLAAIAAQAMEEHGADKVLVAQDARMHEVYLGKFHCDADGLPRAGDDEVIRAVGVLDDLVEHGLEYDVKSKIFYYQGNPHIRHYQGRLDFDKPNKPIDVKPNANTFIEKSIKVDGSIEIIKDIEYVKISDDKIDHCLLKTNLNTIQMNNEGKTNEDFKQSIEDWIKSNLN